MHIIIKQYNVFYNQRQAAFNSAFLIYIDNNCNMDLHRDMDYIDVALRAFAKETQYSIIRSKALNAYFGNEAPGEKELNLLIGDKVR